MRPPNRHVPLQQQERHARAGTLYGDHRQEELIAIAIMPNSDPDGDDGWPKPSDGVSDRLFAGLVFMICR